MGTAPRDPLTLISSGDYDARVLHTTAPGRSIPLSAIRDAASAIYAAAVRTPLIRLELPQDRINPLLGKKVILHYREYRGIPTDCFGSTDYFVDNVQEAKD